MSLTYLKYEGDGSTVNFVSPSYNSEYSEIIVLLDGVINGNYNFLNSNTIHFFNAPANGVIIEIMRQTEMDQRLVDFTNGSILSESTLDKDSNQLFYLIQEQKGYSDKVYNDLIDKIELELTLNKGGENFKETFISSLNQVNFTVSNSYFNINDNSNVDLFINGIYQNKNTFNVSSTNTITLNVGTKLNDYIEICYGKKYTDIVRTVKWVDVKNKPLITVERGDLGEKANISIGYDSLTQKTTGEHNIAIGENTLSQNTDNNDNIAIGFSSLLFNNNGDANIGIGSFSLMYNTNGLYNNALGFETLRNNTNGWGNLALGYKTLRSNTIGNSNIGVGSFSLYTNTTGIRNLGLGYNSLYKNTIGNSNTSVGYESLYNNTEGSYNVSVGENNLSNNNLGNFNSALGYNCLSRNFNSNGNTAMGYNSQYSNYSGSFNSSLGYNSLTHNYDGINNTAIGKDSLSYLTSGSNFTNLSNCTGIGYNSRVSNSNQVQLGDSTTTTYAYGSVQDRSDKRDKIDIKSTSFGLDFINMLNPVEYRFNHRERYKVLNSKGEIISLINDGSKAGKRFHQGFIAQEIEEIINKTGLDFGGFQDHKKDGKGEDVLSLGYIEFIAPMVKAIQELNNKVQILEEKLKNNI